VYRAFVKTFLDWESDMSFACRTWPLISLSFLALTPCAQAALEKAAGHASTSVGMANTAGNAWALETDPSISSGPDAGGPPISSYYLSGTNNLMLFYDTTQFKLDTNSNFMPDLQHSTQGVNNFYVQSYQIDYYANPVGSNTDPGGHPDSYSGTDANGEPLYPSITVTLDPQPGNPDAATDSYNPDADGNLPDMFLPVGLIENIVSVCPTDDLTSNPNATQDLVMYDFLFTGPGTTVNNPLGNGVGVGPNTSLVFTDPSLSPSDPDSTVTAAGPSNVDSSVVPEPTSASILAIAAAGLFRRRRSR
jgi:hypothetical protein